jgi:hypothetical protein
MMEVFSSYPVKKIQIEFLNGDIYANGRKYSDIHELVEWIKDCEKIHRIPFNSGIPR